MNISCGFRNSLRFTVLPERIAATSRSCSRNFRNNRANYPARILLFLVCIFLPVLVNAGIYKWVDEEGRTHYSDSAPDGSSREFTPEPEPKAEAVRRAREEMKSLLERGRQHEEARKAEKERQLKENLTREQEEDSRIQSCIFAQEQLQKLNLQRPVFRVFGKGDEVYVDYLGKRLIFGDNDERLYIDDVQRSAEIGRYEDEVESYCGDEGGDQEKLGEARVKLFKERMCVKARERLEMLANPRMHTPASDLDKAESWMKLFCNE
jgi:hypothetical protein